MSLDIASDKKNSQKLMTSMWIFRNHWLVSLNFEILSRFKLFTDPITIKTMTIKRKLWAAQTKAPPLKLGDKSVDWYHIKLTGQENSSRWYYWRCVQNIHWYSQLNYFMVKLVGAKNGYRSFLGTTPISLLTLLQYRSFW